MPSLFMAQNFIFVVLLCLTVVEKKNAVVSVLVGDEDSSTICKVRKNVEHEVEKWSDVVHAKRSFGCSLYSIKTQNKSLTDMVIQYFQQCFGYTLNNFKGITLDTKGNTKSFHFDILRRDFT